MSYGSTFVPFEPHGKISARHTRVRRELPERPTRVVRYEKQFDVNLSRLDDPPPSKGSIRDSMLAYSKKMRSLHDARHSSSNGSSGGGGSEDKLFVRAKHIPKYPTREPKKRRPMSFDELLGRDRDSTDVRAPGVKQRPHSDKTKPVRDSGKKTETEVRLPILTERYKKSGSIHVSLVSASDLYDFVDFSLKSKGTKSDSLKLLRLEQEAQAYGSRDKRFKPWRGNVQSEDIVPPDDFYDKFERTTDNFQQEYLRRDRYPFFNTKSDNIAPDAEFYEEVFALDGIVDISSRQETQMNSRVKLPSLTSNEPIKRRPNRAKRMRLVDSMLGDIPEDQVFTTGDNHLDRIQFQSRRVISPPSRMSVNKTDLHKASLDSIQENTESGPMITSKTQNDSHTQAKETCHSQTTDMKFESTDSIAYNDTFGEYRSIFPVEDNPKSTKKILIRDDGDVRIEVTQCPPKQLTMNTKQKAQKKIIKKLIYLRDGAR